MDGYQKFEMNSVGGGSNNGGCSGSGCLSFIIAIVAVFGFFGFLASLFK